MKSFFLALMLVASAAGESKTEADLRIRLANTEAALAAATKERAALATSIARLNADNLERLAQTAAISKAAVTGRLNATDVANSNAASAELTAQSNAAIASQTALKAAVDSAASRAAIEQIQKSSDRATLELLITQVFVFFGGLAAFFYKSWTDGRERRWAKEDAVAHQKDMLTKLGEVKQEAHNAYTEANTVNLKIADIGLKMKDGKPLNPNEPASK